MNRLNATLENGLNVLEVSAISTKMISLELPLFNIQWYHDPIVVPEKPNQFLIPKDNLVECQSIIRSCWEDYSYPFVQEEVNHRRTSVNPYEKAGEERRVSYEPHRLPNEPRHSFESRAHH